VKRKILIMNSFYTPDIVGGAEVSTQVLAEFLKRKFNVFVLSSSSQTEEVKYEQINGVNVIRLPKGNIYNAIEKHTPSTLEKLKWHYKNNFNKKQKKIIAEVIRDINPDIIHTQNLNEIGTYVWSLAKKNKIVLVHTLRDYQLYEPTKLKPINFCISLINRYRSKNVDHVVGISKYILDTFEKRKFFEKSQKHVIYNTVNNKYLGKKERKEEAPLKIGYFGRLESEKGINYFLDIVSELSEDMVGQIIVGGTGSEEQNLTNKYKSDKRIKALGKLSFEETQQYISKVDLVIVPSLWPEPFGRVLIEAYRQGTPVLATDVGGIPEIIQSKDYLISTNDKDELKNKIMKFYHLNELEYNELSNDCLKHSRLYTDTVEDYTKLYLRIFNN
jgi:glycosyltransferase involved in cell wall biosynthesis